MKNRKNIFLTIGGALLLSLTLLMSPIFVAMTFANSKSLDSMFTNSSFEFNPELAKMSLALSASSYGEASDSAEVALEGLGFSNDHTYDIASYEQTGKVGLDSVAYSLGSKKISASGKTYDLIALVIRGTHSDNEWLSNFNINNSGDYSTAHEGFSKAEKEVLASLRKYADSLGATPASTKLFITGHSRGAAVANLLAAELMGDALPSAKSIATSSNIYTYTFATPNVAIIKGEATQNFLNIFNAVDSADIITQMPFVSWGYGKFGVNYTIPQPSDAEKTNATVTQQVISEFSALAPTVLDFYKQEMGATFLEGSQIPKSCMEAHAIDSYAAWLNAADPTALKAEVLKKKLMLIPNKNYA